MAMYLMFFGLNQISFFLFVSEKAWWVFKKVFGDDLKAPCLNYPGYLPVIPAEVWSFGSRFLGNQLPQPQGLLKTIKKLLDPNVMGI